MTRAEEQLVVDTREVPIGTVTIHRTVEERPIAAQVPLRIDEYAVERVAVGRNVEHPEPIREENGVLIVPVHEEVLVVEKKLVLREELHLVRRTSETSRHVEDRLRTERVEVIRRAPEDARKESK